ncbi:unnamed protein product [Didymodactylos carnosus]|uniref:Uncharacterized protein n=1 Tax=Didymodactylos carnosus TaxID=1234261 RepID=A0A814J1F0_9BILA|nr:unnamed protein product [Didymodactylos carnosus]CAF3801975.1 unnamed protein product [Didymodactylos carnosus]
MCLYLILITIASTIAATTPATAVLLTNTFTKCLYSFTATQFPSFTLPPAQPHSPGDQRLNLYNDIRLSNGSALNAGQGCNGGRSSGEYGYLNESNGQWMTSYTDADGRSANLNVFYATAQSALNVVTLQTNYGNLGSTSAATISAIMSSSPRYVLALLYRGYSNMFAHMDLKNSTFQIDAVRAGLSIIQPILFV